MNPVRTLRYHLLDHVCIVGQLTVQLVVTIFSLLFALPIHVASLITRPRAAARKPAHESYFITGASSGIGAALAIRLASLPDTASIHLCGRDEERLEATRRACRGIASSTALRISIVVADVANADRMKRSILAADAAERSTGDGSLGLTSVVANAGVTSKTVGKGKLPGFEASSAVLDINMNGTLNTLNPILPLFVERRQGQVVIVSSCSAIFTGLPMLSAYGASKAAQRYYGEALRGKYIVFLASNVILCLRQKLHGGKLPKAQAVSTDGLGLLCQA